MRHTFSRNVTIHITDAGNDEPLAEGNDDGHPTKNNVFKNKIWSDSKEVIRFTSADGNDIYVSRQMYRT